MKNEARTKEEPSAHGRGMGSQRPFLQCEVFTAESKGSLPHSCKQRVTEFACKKRFHDLPAAKTLKAVSTQRDCVLTCRFLDLLYKLIAVDARILRSAITL